MPIWSIHIEPRDETYVGLVQAAVVRGATAGLVVQNVGLWDASFSEFMRKLSEHSPRVRETNEWPGTVLGNGNQAWAPAGGWPKLYTFDLNVQSARLLTTYAAGLYDWLHPRLPEDLCFFDRVGSVWMSSISHEEDAYLTLTADELERLRADVPGLQGGWDAVPSHG